MAFRRFLPTLSIFIFMNCALAFGAASAEDRIIVTATRLDTPAEQVASSVTVITRQEMEETQTRTVGDALRDVPGLSVGRYGGPGQLTPITLRGVGSGHTLVLIDGVKVNDPSEVSRSFDFGNLSTQNIERIEVVRGAESVLYGSDAISGVIQIFTKKGRGPLKSAVEGEYGAYGSYRTSAALSGSGLREGAPYAYALSAELKGSGGYSAADWVNGNPEADRSRLASFSGRVSAEPAERLQAELSALYSAANFDMDAGGGPGGDDPDYVSTERKLASGLQLKWNRSLWWQPVLSLNHARTWRTSDNEPDPSHPTFLLHDAYQGQRFSGELQNNIFLSPEQSVVFSLGAERETATFREVSNFGASEAADPAAALFGAALQYQYASDAFISSAGLRLDRHTRFGTHGTYRLAPGYRIAATGTMLKGSLGTGFKAPSLYQLFSGQYGNPALQPETSFGWDLGFEQALLDGAASVSATYFNNSLENLIYTRAASVLEVGRYQNVFEASSRGVEIASSAQLPQRLGLRLSYTYTLSKEGRTGLPLDRVPKHQLSGVLSYPWSDAGQVSLQLRYFGVRSDFDPVVYSQRIRMPSHTVLNLSGSYSLGRWARGLQLFGRIENLLNRRYQEIAGYGTAERSLFVGFRQEI